ncbi:MAG: flagellar biosynthetic protein FliO, partial [Treponema sp.]|nr:flagellar biosynthetic protein FliO [Treponema sp.]
GSPSDYSVLRILLTLAVVAAAIYGLVYFVKRAGRGKKTRDPFLKILASTPVAANRSVVVVSLGSQAWLIGSSENGVNLISEIQDQDILNAMIVEDSKRGAAGSGKFTDFKTLLSRLGMRSQTGNEGTEKIRKRRERLKGLQ